MGAREGHIHPCSVSLGKEVICILYTLHFSAMNMHRSATSTPEDEGGGGYIYPGLVTGEDV